MLNRVMFVLALWSVATLVTGSGVAAGAPEPVGPPATVTYIANEGFLVECGGRKFLIDALYRAGVVGYAVISYETRQKMEAAKPPFDVDIVLATHYHDDHFNADAVGTHLVNNPEALFIGTSECDEALKDFERYDDIKSRLHTSVPTEGDIITVDHAGIRVDVMNIHHGRTRTVRNLGYLIQIDGRSFLHIGDSQADADLFKRYKLERSDIDIAFIPYWYLAYAKRKTNFRNGIQAANIIPMHIPPKDLRPSFMDDFGGWQFGTDQMKREFKNVTIYADELEKHTFE